MVTDSKLYFKQHKNEIFWEFAMTILVAQILSFFLMGFIDLGNWSPPRLPIHFLVTVPTVYVYLKYFSWKYEFYSNQIKIIYPFNNKKNYTIPLKDIVSITVNQRSKMHGLIIHFRDKSIGISFPSVFEAAEGLKTYKESGIKIVFDPKDHEIELFLDGRIPSVPMTNDMDIKPKPSSNKEI